MTSMHGEPNKNLGDKIEFVPITVQEKSITDLNDDIMDISKKIKSLQSDLAVFERGTKTLDNDDLINNLSNQIQELTTEMSKLQNVRDAKMSTGQAKYDLDQKPRTDGKTMGNGKDYTDWHKNAL